MPTPTRMMFFGQLVRVKQMLAAVDAQEAFERSCRGRSNRSVHAIQNANRARLAAGAKRQKMVSDLYAEEQEAFHAWRASNIRGRAAGRAVLEDLPSGEDDDTVSGMGGGRLTRAEAAMWPGNG